MCFPQRVQSKTRHRGPQKRFVARHRVAKIPLKFCPKGPLWTWVSPGPGPVWGCPASGTICQLGSCSGPAAWPLPSCPPCHMARSCRSAFRPSTARVGPASRRPGHHAGGSSPTCGGAPPPPQPGSHLDLSTSLMAAQRAAPRSRACAERGGRGEELGAAGLLEPAGLAGERPPWGGGGGLAGVGASAVCPSPPPIFTFQGQRLARSDHSKQHPL